MKDISLIIIDNHNHDLARFSIEKTLQNLNCKEVITFSDREILPGAKFVHIKPTLNMFEYSQIVLKHLWLHINTEYVLITHWDGMAVDKTQWDDEYLRYDYIGAPWGNGVVGNGGFCLRSRKLIEALSDNQIQLGSSISGQNKDVAICNEFRQLLVSKYNIQYAPIELATRFSIEHNWKCPTFGFHGIWNAARYLNKDELIYIKQHMPRYIINSSKYSAWQSSLIEFDHRDLL